MNTITRQDDMGQGKLRLIRDDDGDITVALVLPGHGFLSVEFCVPGTGGGKSPRTWRALGELLKAMEADEAAEKNLGRRAPVQASTHFKRPAGTVPWEVHEEAWREYDRAGHGRDQSAERIAERGGFSYREMQCALAGHYNKCFTCCEAHPDVPGWEARA